MAHHPDPPCLTKAALALCACNILALLFVSFALLRPAYQTSPSLRLSWHRSEDAKIKDAEAARIREALEARRALEPVELIKRVKEIQEESSKAVLKDHKSSAARKTYATLAERLKQSKGANTKKNQQALEEWLRKKQDPKKHNLVTQDKYGSIGTEATED